ncbi:Ion transport protein-domain-containing protein [Globomyces pollinis-pini]|nr:Ion transport protein-domain-containing protein [Globomyces pollinis-pini]
MTIIQQKDQSLWRQFLISIVESDIYSYLLFALVIIDVSRLLYEADVTTSNHYNNIDGQSIINANEIIKLLALTFYIFDLFLRITAYEIKYFQSGYNIFDLFVVLNMIVVIVFENAYPYFSTYIGLRLLKGLQIVRIFRIIPLIRSLELVVNALIYTMRTSVVDVILLAIMLIFILGIFGHFIFGIDNTYGNAFNDWHTLSNSFFTIWVYICGDGWLKHQDRLRMAGYDGAWFVSIVLIFIGNFIISNLFIGVISQNVYEASQAETLRILQLQKEANIAKRELFFRKQQRDLLQLIQQKTNRNGGFQDIIRNLAGALKHDEVIPVKHLAFNILWLETFIVTLYYHENTLFRCQQCHFSMIQSLVEYVDRRLHDNDDTMKRKLNK